MKTLDLDPEAIAVKGRLRDIDPAHVDDLVAAIRVSGWISPILVIRDFDADGNELLELAAGNHRLEAARRLGRMVPATLIDLDTVDEDHLRLLEISENLHRKELTASERVEHQALLTRIHEKRHGVTSVSALARESAKALGVSESTAKRVVARARSLSPVVLRAVKSTPLDNGRFLDLLAEMPDDEARLQRIERELSRLADRKQDSNPRQAAEWIKAILERGLSRSEIAQIAGLLPLTTRDALRRVLHETH